MSAVITKHCALLEQMKQNNEYNQDRDDILHDFQTELTHLQSSDPVLFRQEMMKVTGLLNDHVLNLNQAILTYFLNYLAQILKRWYTLTAQDDLDIFENLTNIFITHSDNLTNELFVQEFRLCLEKIAQTGKELFSHPYIRIITCLLKTCTLIESDNKYRFMDVSPYDDAIVKCLCAPYTIEIFTLFQSSVQSEERTETENFLFDGLFDHVSLLNRDELEKQSSQLREHFMPSLSRLLDTFLVSSNEWSDSAMTILTHSTTLFLYAVQMTMPNDIHLDLQKHICDTAIQILLSATYRSMKFNNNCIQYIYMGTLHDRVLDYLKGKQLTSTMFQISNLYKNESEIQFNIYRILAAIMTEEDIKRLDDPGAIASIFIEYLIDVSDRAGSETRLRNLLTTLKILLQHDQIRDEIYQQNGIPLFINCATKTKYDALLRQRAIENLLIMSFNESVCANLKENASFMSQIEVLSQDSTQSDLQRASQSLLWILTKDDASKASPDDQSSGANYDVMISYSHKDKDLCFQLYDRLKKDRFRVWIDRDEMHGTPLESMSNAIEKSEFVFICMSDAYKQSGYCKMEAYYALERQCSIIPLVMKAQYRPDGWLGIIVTGRMRIDFPKYGFEDAYRNLMNEITRNRKEKKSDKSSHHHHELVSSANPSNDNNPMKENKIIEKIVYQAKSDHTLPSNIEQWTADDVQQFLIKHNFESFLGICARMNGTRLVGLYRMCVTNSPVMLQTLNNQLAATNPGEKGNIIEVDEYLQFLEQLKSFVPVFNEKKEGNSSQSSVCVVL